ncbi:hypothetical protein MTYP_01692 [Methylophilaceae bacterium]|nr:hypothetical protein MTYP_01692 [Methylophilaceae bacterium]
MNWKVALFVLVIGFGAYQSWQKREAAYSPGAPAPHAPAQRASANSGQVFINGHRIKPLEGFSIEARVLSVRHYNHDRESSLAPVDLALGWGRMADDAVLRHIDISQRNRWYFWRTDNFPIPRREIETHSANMHMIPANAEIENKLKSVSSGKIVRINGYLVEADANDGWRWRSSLTREDTGPGACELVLVETLTVL